MKFMKKNKKILSFFAIKARIQPNLEKNKVRSKNERKGEKSKRTFEKYIYISW